MGQWDKLDNVDFGEAVKRRALVSGARSRRFTRLRARDRIVRVRGELSESANQGPSFVANPVCRVGGAYAAFTPARCIFYEKYY